MCLTNGRMCMPFETALEHKRYQVTSVISFGSTLAVKQPVKIPVINIAAANIPAVCACCGSTVCGAYIIPSELLRNKKKYTQLGSAADFGFKTF